MDLPGLSPRATFKLNNSAELQQENMLVRYAFLIVSQLWMFE